MRPAALPPTPLDTTPWVILLVGMVAAVGVGKVPPVLLAISGEFGMSLLQASFVVSLFQIAGAFSGLFAGTLADRYGAVTIMQAGLAVLLAGVLSGALAPSASWLLASRAVESLGFILTVLPGPAILRTAVPGQRLKTWLGLWATYMPGGVMLAMLLTPLVAVSLGWRLVWAAHAVAIVLVWLALRHAVREQVPGVRPSTVRFWPMFGRVLGAGAPWLLAASFGAYAGQYLSIIAFLPTIYQQAGIALTTAGALTALVAGINIVGNVGAGVMIERGTNPGILLCVSACALIAGSWFVFATDASFSWRYAAVLATSAICGLLPATLFVLAPRCAPDPQSVSGTVGLMQQGSALGQVVLPPLVATAATMAGGWQNTWIVIGGFALINLMLGVVIGLHQGKRPD